MGSWTWEHVHMNPGAHRGMKSALDALELAVNCQTWILVSELTSSVRAVHAFNCSAIPLVPEARI